MATENITAAFQAKENFYARKGLTALPEPHITGLKLLGDVSLGSLTLNTRDERGAIWVCTDIRNWWTTAEPDYPKIERAFGDGSYDVSGRYLSKTLELAGSILVPEPKYAPIVRTLLVESLDLVYKGAWLKTVESQGVTEATTLGSITDNIVTLTTAHAHTINVGDSVVVAGSNASFTGTYIVLSTTANTVSYAKTSSNVAETSFIGTITSSPVVKSAWVRLAGSPTIDSVTARGRINFNAELTAPDPIKYYWDTANQSGYESVATGAKNISLGRSGTYSIINRGNTPVGLKISITGPTSGPLTITNSTTNQTLTVRESVSGDNTLSVAKKAYSDGAATITTSGPHNLYAGKQITISDVDSNFNGIQTVKKALSEDKFTFSMDYGKEATFNSYSVSGSTVTATSSSTLPYVVGDLITIQDLDAAANVKNASVLSVSGTSLTYETDRTRSVQSVSFEPTTAVGGFDTVTLTTWEAHGVRASQQIQVEGCGRPVSPENGSALNVTATAVTPTTITYVLPSLTREITAISVAKSTKGKYKVTVTTGTTHSFKTGDSIQLRGVLAGGTEPPGINTGSDGSFTIERINDTKVSYEVTPPSTTNTGLISYFGAASGSIPISPQRNNHIRYASFRNRPVNSSTAGSSGGTVSCSATISTTSKTFTSVSDYIEEVASSGTIAVPKDTLILDTKERSASLGGSATYARSKLDVVTDWVKLAPGVNIIEIVDAGNAASTASITTEYRSGWLS